MDISEPEVPVVDTALTQTITAIAQVMVKDDSTALLLGLLGFSATKLWNTAVWHTRKHWDETGKIPSYYDLDRMMKESHPVWYRRLHSQSAQAVLEELWQSYRSWFALRKKEGSRANPPGYRKKATLSPVTFKQSAVVWDPERSTIRLSIPKGTYDRQFIHLKVKLPKRFTFSNDDVQIGRLVFRDGRWYIHLAHKIPVPEMKGAGEVMAMDLNVKNLAGSICTDGTSAVWSGGELSSLERYFEKEKSRTTKSTSRKSSLLNRKRSRQRLHLLHSFTRSVVRDAKARGVSTVIVGYPKDIRDGKDWGAKGNQRLHRWPFKLIFDMLRYKARIHGIRVVDIGEEYTSQTCTCCGTRNKNNRVHRGLYVCSTCGAVMHADINAASNILAKYHATYLPEEAAPSWSSGCLAQPVVNRFAWRNARPHAHEPGTWHRSMPHLRTGSALTLSC